MLLALDTATRMASVALYDQKTGWVPAEETWCCNDNHTVELMLHLVRLMEQQGVSPADLDAIVVSLGPGSFTGLRTGLGVAKGLAVARSLPLIGIPTLEVVARPHMQQALPIWAVLQAGRGRVCAGHFVRRRGRWHQRLPYLLTTLDKLCAEIEQPALLCGEIEASDVDLIRDHLGPDVAVATPAAALRRAAYLAELGWERLAVGPWPDALRAQGRQVDDVATLSPIYVQQPQIDG